MIQPRTMIKRIAMVLLLMAFGTVFSHAQEFERNHEKVMRRGLDFTFSESKEGTFTVGNKTSKALHVARSIQLPVTVNGTQVNAPPDVRPVYRDSSFRNYVFTNLSGVLSTLNDGEYTLNLRDILIDTSGVIVFFGYEGTRSIPPVDPLTLEKQLEIYNKLCTAMDNAVAFVPGYFQQRKALSFMNDADIWEAKFKVKDHVFSDTKKK